MKDIKYDPDSEYNKKMAVSGYVWEPTDTYWMPFVRNYVLSDHTKVGNNLISLSGWYLDLQQVPIKLDNKGKPKAEYGSGYITTYLPFHVVELMRQKVLSAGYNVSSDDTNPDYDQKLCSFLCNYILLKDLHQLLSIVTRLMITMM